MVHINTEIAKATVSFQGAQVLHYQVKGEEPLLWQGVKESFKPGRAIRAGVPICWPWFSAHPDSRKPSHGFARLSLWELTKAQLLPDGRFTLSFLLGKEAPDFACSATLNITLGTTLEMELISSNNGDLPLTISQALHTYFLVGDVGKVSVRGLENSPYYEQGVCHSPQDSPAEVVSGFEHIERFYVDPAGFCEVIDPVLNRSLIITSTGCQSTVLWNPGRDIAEQMGDLGEDGYQSMLCVESGNLPITGDRVIIPAKGLHRLAVQYRTVKGAP